MFRIISLLFFGAFFTATSALQAQSVSDKQTQIKSAENAAPAAISGQATIMDWEGNILRQGTNDWTCYPTMPGAKAENPMCLDEQWVKWLEAYMNQQEPAISDVGMGYMLQGGEPNSNLDPFAEGPTPDNQWMDEIKPHLMILYPDQDMYEDIPVDPDNGGPWVMFPNTPYIHVMVPVE